MIKRLIIGILIIIGTMIGVMILSWLFGIPFFFLSMVLDDLEYKLTLRFGEWGIAIMIFSVFAIAIVIYFLISLSDKIFKRKKK